MNGLDVFKKYDLKVAIFEDLDKLEFTEEEKLEQIFCYGEEYKKYLIELIRHSVNCMRLKYENNTIFIAGALPIRNKIYELWLLPSKLFYTHKLISIRILLNLLYLFEKEIEWNRLQIYCKNTFIKFTSLFNFQPEGVLRQYGRNREDFFIMGKIRWTR